MVRIFAEFKNKPGEANERKEVFAPNGRAFESMQQAEMQINQIIVDGGFYYPLTPNEVAFYPMTTVDRFVIVL